MGEVVYVLCAVTCLACAVLLVRAWLASRTRLLFWSSVCFVGLFCNNVLLVIDEVLAPDQMSLIIARDLTNTLSVAALLVGLVWNSGSR